MDTKTLLETLSEVANSLDEKNHYKQADRITDLMVRVSQMPVPNKPYVNKGFLGNLGDALGGAGKWVGQQAAAGYKAVKENAPAIGNAAMWVAAPGAKLGYEGAKGVIKFVQKNQQINKEVQQAEKNQQSRYQIGLFLKKYTDSAYSSLRTNPTLDNLVKVRLDMKNQAMNDQNYAALDRAAQNGAWWYKEPLLKILVWTFERYMPGDLKTKLATNYNTFDESGNPTWTDEWKAKNSRK